MISQPQVIVIAGPNGAGKSTAAAFFLPLVFTYVNADEIARKLPGYPSPTADRLAGRLHLAKLDELEERRAHFAVETTLASRSLAPRINRLREAGYYFRLIFLYLLMSTSPSNELRDESYLEATGSLKSRFDEDTRRGSGTSSSCINRLRTTGASTKPSKQLLPSLSPAA